MSTPSDSLPQSIPKLDASGKNWMLFRLRFLGAIEAKGKLGHFDGEKPRPSDEDNAADDILHRQEEWDADEASANYMLQQKLPNSLLIRVAKLANVAERWAMIEKEAT